VRTFRPEPDGGSGLRLVAAVVLAVGLLVTGGALYLHSRTVPRAERLLDRGLDQQARDVLAPEAVDQPGNGRVQALLGRSLLKLGQPLPALDAYEAAAKAGIDALDKADLDALAGALTRRGKVAERAARILEQVGPPAAPAVTAALPRTSGAEKVRALELAGRLDPSRPDDAVATWAPLLEDPDCDVRRAATRHLSDSGNPAAVPALQALASRREGRTAPGVTPSDRMPSVCGALEAAEALARLQTAPAR
jgi:tetratricopeptide (TPR) repeat protein